MWYPPKNVFRVSRPAYVRPYSPLLPLQAQRGKLRHGDAKPLSTAGHQGSSPPAFTRCGWCLPLAPQVSGPRLSFEVLQVQRVAQWQPAGAGGQWWGTRPASLVSSDPTLPCRGLHPLLIPPPDFTTPHTLCQILGLMMTFSGSLQDVPTLE